MVGSQWQRRDFIKAAGASVAAAGLSQVCAQSPDEAATIRAAGVGDGDLADALVHGFGNPAGKLATGQGLARLVQGDDGGGNGRRRAEANLAAPGDAVLDFLGNEEFADQGASK